MYGFKYPLFIFFFQDYIEIISLCEDKSYVFHNICQMVYKTRFYLQNAKTGNPDHLFLLQLDNFKAGVDPMIYKEILNCKFPRRNVVRVSGLCNLEFKRGVLYCIIIYLLAIFEYNIRKMKWIKRTAHMSVRLS